MKPIVFLSAILVLQLSACAGPERGVWTSKNGFSQNQLGKDWNDCQFLFAEQVSSGLHYTYSGRGYYYLGADYREHMRGFFDENGKYSLITPHANDEIAMGKFNSCMQENGWERVSMK